MVSGLEKKSEVAGALPEGILGSLETEIMKVVWDTGTVTTGYVHQQLLRYRDIAYTSVMTVMGNLTHKGLLRRYLEGKSYTYSAAVTRDEFIRSHVTKIMGSLLDRFTEPAVNYLVGRLDNLEEKDLAKLEEEVSRLRRQRKASSETPPEQIRQTEKEERR